MKRRLLFTFYFLLFTFCSKAQLLFYQDTYKGGVTSDGRAYASFDYLQADTINFQLHIPAGASIRKAFLVSQGLIFYANTPFIKDSPLPINFNNHLILIDSSSRVTSYYLCSVGGGYLWQTSNDVTNYVNNSNNKLIIPNQTVLMINDTSRHFVYDGFLLVVMYELQSLSEVNAAIFLNNTTYNSTINYNLLGLNQISVINDVGLSVYTVDPDQDSITYNLVSTLGNTYLGSIGINDINSVPSAYYYNAPGSFYYENNTLFGLKDDNPNNGFDTTDALVNIKNYIANNAQTFTINTTQPTSSGCYDVTQAFILSYSSPCPARSNKDTTISYAICSGNNVQLNGTSVGTYTWSAPNNSLNNYNVPNPIANPTVTTTYIALVDSNGCKHTEHYKVNVYTVPKTDSVKTTIGICGSTAGTATIIATVGSPTSYTLNNVVYSSPTFTNLTAGTYTFALANSFGCTYTSTKPFIIKDTNLAKARFNLTPTSGCEPLSVSCTNYSNYNGNLYSPVTNGYTWYVNGDSAATTNFNYTFTDTGKYTITLLAYETLRQCSAVTTQTVLVKDCPPDSIKIIVPNVFSPNADGINDAWQLVVYNFNYTINNYECLIYDRWGIKVFETNNINTAWDGKTTSGMPSSAGTYYYIIKLTATNSKGVSEQKDFKGYLELVR